MATKMKATAVTIDEKVDNFDELTVENINIISKAFQTNSETMDTLISKVTSLACHVAALEAVLSEVISITGIDLAHVNALIRSRIKAVNGEHIDSNIVVDIAAGIACPATRKSP